MERAGDAGARYDDLIRGGVDRGRGWKPGLVGAGDGEARERPAAHLGNGRWRRRGILAQALRLEADHQAAADIVEIAT